MLKTLEPASENCNGGDGCVTTSHITVQLVLTEGVLQAPGGEAPQLSS